MPVQKCLYKNSGGKTPDCNNSYSSRDKPLSHFFMIVAEHNFLFLSLYSLCSTNGVLQEDILSYLKLAAGTVWS